MTIAPRATLGLLALLAACSTTPASTSSPPPATTAQVVPGSQEDLVANVGDRVFFDFDRSAIHGHGSLTQNNAAVLDRQSAWLMKYNQISVQIAGNCDERGTEEYNLALGQRRADVVRGYLVAKGTSGGRMSTISYGKERPTALESSEDARARNRNAITSVK